MRRTDGDWKDERAGVKGVLLIVGLVLLALYSCHWSPTP